MAHTPHSRAIDGNLAYEVQDRQEVEGKDHTPCTVSVLDIPFFLLWKQLGRFEFRLLEELSGVGPKVEELQG